MKLLDIRTIILILAGILLFALSTKSAPIRVNQSQTEIEKMEMLKKQDIFIDTQIKQMNQKILIENNKRYAVNLFFLGLIIIAILYYFNSFYPLN